MVLACRRILAASFAVSLPLIAFSASGAQAQCAASGSLQNSPLSPTVAMAVAGVSASVNALVTSTNTANTAFLTQSSAFIGSPINPQPDQEGGGVWVRGVGGHVSTSTTSTTSNISFGGPVAASINCNTRTLQDFAGFQVGTDFARLNVNGWNLHAGPTVGYLGVKTQDATLPGLNPGPATFRDSLQIPFAGLYGAASYGGFLVDAQIRGDFFQNEVSDENHGLSGQQFNARSISLTGNVAYNQSLGNQWFIEPSAGIIWSRTNVDPLNVPGTMVLASGAAGPSGVLIPPWLLTVNDIESTLGRLSVRVGTSVEAGDVILQPFASASVFHDFQEGAVGSLTTNFSSIGAPLPTLHSDVSTSSLGTYGQLGLGLAGQVVNTGWLSYVRVDYRTGGNIEGWSANGGLRYQFVPDPTRSRWVPVKAVPATYNWSGFYVGGHVGADWGFTNWNFVSAGTTDPGFAGFLGGGQIGYNYQIGKWVFGIEEAAGWTNAHGARPCPNGFFYNCEIDENWLSTTTARIGYAYWDRLLTYVKGGAAIAQDQARFVCDTNSQPTIPAVALVGCPSESDTKIKVGGTVGVGSEFGLTNNVSVRGEFMYFDLGTDHRNMGGIEADMRRSGFLSTIGLNFRFGG
ncbi:MAG: autotransporter domain-containing protein [Bradyrhizobiaceae bacterium]|nr:autotransporter domain-containing protein [Bradyrhizobiaceae bacterium]